VVDDVLTASRSQGAPGGNASFRHTFSDPNTAAGSGFPKRDPEKDGARRRKARGAGIGRSDGEGSGGPFPVRRTGISPPAGFPKTPSAEEGDRAARKREDDVVAGEVQFDRKRLSGR